jgi:hypothetical protein
MVGQIFAQYLGTSSHSLMGVCIPDNDGDLKKKNSQNVSKTFKLNLVDVHITGPFRNNKSPWRCRWRWCGGGGGSVAVVAVSTKYSILE